MKVGLVMGSTSDLPVVEKAIAVLKEYGVEEKYLFLHYTETAPDAWGWL